MTIVVVWIIICIAGYRLPVGGIYEFYGLAAAVGFVMGGIQSLSRSTFAKLMPETRDTASFFSFYDVTEKIAAVIGIFSFGIINEHLRILLGDDHGEMTRLRSGRGVEASDVDPSRCRRQPRIRTR